MYYQTCDSRLAAFFKLKGLRLTNTETQHIDDDDKVYLSFECGDEELRDLKREFFEGGEVPALEFANHLKSIMHLIREARELARESSN